MRCVRITLESNGKLTLTEYICQVEHVRCVRITLESNGKLTLTEQSCQSRADFGCNRQIWLSFNDCDDTCDPK